MERRRSPPSGGCTNCHADSLKMMFCIRCATPYCSKECQVFHWKKGGHRENCCNEKDATLGAGVERMSEKELVVAPPERKQTVRQIEKYSFLRQLKNILFFMAIMVMWKALRTYLRGSSVVPAFTSGASPSSLPAESPPDFQRAEHPDASTSSVGGHAADFSETIEVSAVTKDSSLSPGNVEESNAPEAPKKENPVAGLFKEAQRRWKNHEAKRKLERQAKEESKRRAEAEKRNSQPRPEI